LHAEKPTPDVKPEQYKIFYDKAAKALLLSAAGHPDVHAAAERGYWLNSDLDYREFYVRVPPAEMKKLKAGVSYHLKVIDNVESARWKIAPKCTVTRP
jgi:hypothetical protein